MQKGSPLAQVHQAIADGVAALRAACDSRADANTRVEALAVCEQLSRQLEQLSVELVAGLDRDGVFTDRCAFPGCQRPPSWCDAHHVKEWQHGGPTAIDNLVMLCRFHHRLIHHTDWEMHITRGSPEFIPPKWIDPQQIPRRKPSCLG